MNEHEQGWEWLAGWLAGLYSVLKWIVFAISISGLSVLDRSLAGWTRGSHHQDRVEKWTLNSLKGLRGVINLSKGDPLASLLWRFVMPDPSSACSFGWSVGRQRAARRCQAAALLGLLIVDIPYSAHATCKLKLSGWMERH